MHLKRASGKWGPFCLGHNVLRVLYKYKWHHPDHLYIQTIYRKQTYWSHAWCGYLQIHGNTEEHVFFKTNSSAWKCSSTKLSSCLKVRLANNIHIQILNLPQWKSEFCMKQRICTVHQCAPVLCWWNLLECLRSEIPPAALWLPTLVIHIRSQVKTIQSQNYKFQKIAKNSNLKLCKKLYTWHIWSC